MKNKDELTSIEDKIKVLYIVGGGHSGSTILSLILGTSPEIHVAGEIKFYNEHKILDHPMWNYIENVCMCGEDANDCPFWKEVELQVDGELNIFHYSSLTDKFLTALKILWPFYHIQKTTQANDDYELFKMLDIEARKRKLDVKYILDSSKSVARLMHLHTHPQLDVKVIFLVRDGRAYVNSYAKAYRQGFFSWIGQWIINNFLTLRYLKKEKIDFYYLSYNALCLETELQLTAIGEKFNFRVPDNYVQLVNDMEYHIRAGNPSRSSLNNFSGLEIDEKWRYEMPRYKRVVSSILLYLFNHWWVY